MSIDILALIEKRRQQWDHVDSAEEALRALGEELRRASRSDYLGTLYRTDFQVSGRGNFPIDMLRYANAWPKGEADASAIERSIDAGARDLSVIEPFVITLTKCHRDREPHLADDRWESKFRWKVLRNTIETTEL